MNGSRTFCAESQEVGSNLCFSQLQKDPQIPDFHHGNLMFSVKDLERGLPNAVAVFSSLMLKYVMTIQSKSTVTVIIYCRYALLPDTFSFNLVNKQKTKQKKQNKQKKKHNTVSGFEHFHFFYLYAYISE